MQVALGVETITPPDRQTPSQPATRRKNTPVRGPGQSARQSERWVRSTPVPEPSEPGAPTPHGCR